MTMYSAPKCPFTVDGDCIVTDGSVRKKVTGTSMGGILGISPWSTPFQVACNLLGLGSQDISAKKAVQRGIALEPRIIRYADHVWGSEEDSCYLSAEEVFEARVGDHDSWSSDFEDDIFAGHVDGIVAAADGDYILEIKTTTNLDSWTDGVPEYYFWQTAVYNEFITKQDKVVFVLGIANENTDRDPASWVPNEDNCIRFIVPVDREAVKAKMDEIRAWYAEYIMNGTTPCYDPSNPGDVELYTHLCDIASGDRGAEALLEQVVSTQRQLEWARELHGINALEDTLKDLKDRLKQALLAGETSALESRDGCFKAVITSRTTTSWEVGKMVADGIDTARYQKESTTYALSVRAVQKKE